MYVNLDFLNVALESCSVTQFIVGSSNVDVNFNVIGHRHLHVSIPSFFGEKSYIYPNMSANITAGGKTWDRRYFFWELDVS